MERFPNFPQTIDPVESETILEQFLELNNNVEIINQGYNELAPQVDTNTTDIAQLKTQVSESGTRVKVNGQLVAEWSPDVLSSDVATNTEDIEQIRLAQSSDSLAIVGLQSDNITNKQNISNLQGDVSSLNQTMQRTLKVPLTFPPEIELVGVDDNGSQIMVQVDSILSTTSENPVQNKVVSEKLEINSRNIVNLDLTKAQIDYIWNGSIIGGNTINVDVSGYKYLICDVKTLDNAISPIIIDTSVTSVQIGTPFSNWNQTNGIVLVEYEFAISSDKKSISFSNNIFYHTGSTLGNNSGNTLIKIVGVK